MNSEEKFNELIKGCGKEAYFIEENEDLVLCGEDRTRKETGEVIKFFCYECENKLKSLREELKELLKGRFDTANDTANHTANQDHLNKLRELKK